MSSNQDEGGAKPSSAQPPPEPRQEEPQNEWGPPQNNGNMKIMAIIFIGSMVFDQLMRYALPVENTGDGKAALQQATKIADEEVPGM